MFLIDEFKNSFGVNCVDTITSKISSNSFNNQFILSSHHKYIINNILIEKWRLVARNNTNVKMQSVIDKLSSKSKHQAFIQFINLDEYNEGFVL